ncbi:MAG TPA: hypothetical protein VGQ04_14885 [Chitinophagaceae bacterium]|jgi:hypothetical protein|nr:hypothetical protein [Chitinophagaceae bacterium]
MQDTLYEFLLLNKKLSLPGIGTISLCQNSATLDFTNKQFTSPSFYFTIESRNDKPSKKLFDWLSSSFGITEWDAIKSVNDFSFDLKKKLSEKGEVNWENVGMIRRNNNGDLKIETQTIILQSEQPVTAEKVIRVKAEHTVLVGEQEKTSVEMQEYFAESTKKKNYTWLIAAIIAVLAVIFIGWYFSEKGFSTSSAGNQTVIKSN